MIRTVGDLITELEKFPKQLNIEIDATVKPIYPNLTLCIEQLSMDWTSGQVLTVFIEPFDELKALKNSAKAWQEQVADCQCENRQNILNGDENVVRNT